MRIAFSKTGQWVQVRPLTMLPPGLIGYIVCGSDRTAQEISDFVRRSIERGAALPPSETLRPGDLFSLAADPAHTAMVIGYRSEGPRRIEGRVLASNSEAHLHRTFYYSVDEIQMCGSAEPYVPDVDTSNDVRRM